jgi:hypothetical protein
MPMSPRLLRPVSAGFHPEAQVWRNAVIANGGTVSGSTLKAVSDFCKSIDQAGIRDRFYRLNLFAGTGLNACLVPLYRGQSRTGTQFGNATDTNGGPFVSGDYSESTGLNSGANNSGKSLDTGLTPNDVGVATGHLAVYSPVGASSAVGLSRVIGSIQNSPQQFYAVYKNNLSTGTDALWGGGAALVNATMSAGLTVWQREASNVLRHYTNGSLTATNTTNITPGSSGVSFAVFDHKTSTGFSGANWHAALRGYSIGKHFTSGQMTDYYNAIQAFQTALGRNV